MTPEEIRPSRPSVVVRVGRGAAACVEGRAVGRSEPKSGYARLTCLRCCAPAV